MTSENESPVKQGDVLDGKYRVERVLGVGGMGVVVSARHIELNTRVALKFMLAEALREPESVARFKREARAAVRLKSEHTARVTDVGSLKNGAPYMVMEFLTGRDLGDVIEKGGVRVAEGVDFILQACEAIAEAHAAGIVHRDLKPRNLFLTRRLDGRPLIKVLDFGLAKTIDPMTGDRGLTKTMAVMGSPQYMSPEQMRASRDVDGRTDIWSLGVCLYELLTGKVPFDADTIPLLCVMVMKEAARSPNELRPEIPAELAAVVMRCIEKETANRYADVSELAAALEPFGSDSVGSANRVRLVLHATGTDHEPPQMPEGRVADVASFTMAAGASETRTAATFDTQLGKAPTNWAAMKLGGAAIGAIVGMLGVAGVYYGVALFQPAATFRGPSAPTREPPLSGDGTAVTAAPLAADPVVAAAPVLPAAASPVTVLDAGAVAAPPKPAWRATPNRPRPQTQTTPPVVAATSTPAPVPPTPAPAAPNSHGADHM